MFNFESHDLCEHLLLGAAIVTLLALMAVLLCKIHARVRGEQAEDLKILEESHRKREKEPHYLQPYEINDDVLATSRKIANKCIESPLGLESERESA